MPIGGDGAGCARNVDAPKWLSNYCNGIPTLVEKPVARTSAEVEELNAFGVYMGSELVFSQSPASSRREDARSFNEGIIGRLLSVEGRMVTVLLPGTIPHWLFQKRRPAAAFCTG